MVAEAQGVLTCRSSTLAILARFWPVSWTITLFWGLGVISMIDEPLVRLRVGHQHSHILPILARFLDYYSILGSWSHFDD